MEKLSKILIGVIVLMIVGVAVTANFFINKEYALMTDLGLRIADKMQVCNADAARIANMTGVYAPHVLTLSEREGGYDGDATVMIKNSAEITKSFSLVVESDSIIGNVINPMVVNPGEIGGWTVYLSAENPPPRSKVVFAIYDGNTTARVETIVLTRGDR